jgi:hypothetical protein
VDRHFTSAAQISAVNTLIHRRWPSQGLLSIVHVDSDRNPMVQLADLVAPSVYSWHKSGDRTMQLIAVKFGVTLVEDWRAVKARWL